MSSVLTGAIHASMQNALGPSARWSVRRAAVILAVLLAHLSLMVSPLHAEHVERAGHAERADHAERAVHAEKPLLVEQSAHAVDAGAASSSGSHVADQTPHVTDQTSHATAPPRWHGGGSLTLAPTLSTHEASAEDCRIEWTRTREQPAGSSLVAVAAAPSLNGLQVSPPLPAHAALVSPLRRGDIQALLQVYRL